MAATEIVDPEGDRLVPIMEDRLELGYMALTRCCGATGKGLTGDGDDEGYVGCRVCYAEVGWKYGVPLNADGTMRRETSP